MNKEDKKEAQRLYSEGFTVKAICEILDSNSSAVYRALKGVSKIPYNVEIFLRPSFFSILKVFLIQLLKYLKKNTIILYLPLFI